jgi:N-acyl-D-aspartate/D-glutamate deacylase
MITVSHMENGGGRAAFDLVLRNATVVDGTGAPRYSADVAVLDGRLIEVSPDLPGRGAKELDVSGHIVAPGFIDVHTHYDAQVLWDPLLDSSSKHGVTTALMGNCGFGIAPVRSDDVDYVIQMLARVEGMSADALRAGPSWAWESFPEYLEAVDKPLGLNVMAQVGHSPLRYFVMGPDAYERPATGDEIRAMCTVLDGALAAGAWGFTSSTSPTHNDSAGRPVPSRLATREEFVALSDVVGRYGFGFIGISPGSKFVGISTEERDLMKEMSVRGGAVVHWNPLTFSSNMPELFAKNLEVSAEGAAVGARICAVANPGVGGPTRFDFANPFLFDALPHWKSITREPLGAKLAAYSEREIREGLKRDLDDDSELGFLTRMFRAMWDHLEIVQVFAEANQALVGKTIGQVAAEEGRHPLDVALDIVCRDDLRTVLMSSQPHSSPEGAALEAIQTMAGNPDILLGGSDAGAHIDFMSNEALVSRTIASRVRSDSVLDLERVVHGFTGHLADVLGLQGRGRIAPGYAADLVVFDEDTIDSTAPFARHDLPAGALRMVTDAIGIALTLVAGDVVFDRGLPTGARPGRLLRSGARN